MRTFLATLFLSLAAGCSSAPPPGGSAANDWEYGSYAGRPVKSGPGM
jgi:hypothetical protein